MHRPDSSGGQAELRRLLGALAERAELAMLDVKQGPFPSSPSPASQAWSLAFSTAHSSNSSPGPFSRTRGCWNRAR